MMNDEGQYEQLQIVILATESKVNKIVNSTEIMLEQNNIEHPSWRLIEVLKVIVKLEFLIQIKQSFSHFIININDNLYVGLYDNNDQHFEW